MAWFVGLDLAWSSHRETGVCVLEGDARTVRVQECFARPVEPAALAAWLKGLGPDVVVAVDAPLLVSPERTAERHLARAFGRNGAVAYTATEQFLRDHNSEAGPRLGAALAECGFSLAPHLLAPSGRGRHAFEMYPHAAHVALFGLAWILKYKKGPVADRVAALAEYQRLLSGALASLPDNLPCQLRDVLEPAALLAKGAARKRLEDQLDAVTCAIVARHAWRAGAEGVAVFGCPEHGHIVTPGLPPGRTMPPPLCEICPG